MTSESPLFAITDRLSESRVAETLRLLEREIRPRLEKRPRGYARGRQYAWLAWQPSFGEPKEAVERPRGELWEELASLVPGIETAECFRNGNESSLGIHPHRDSPYAAKIAFVLNLGSTRFRIWLPNEAPVDSALEAVKVHRTLTEYEAHLEGGELISFDCKRMHGSRSEAEERWAIGMWKFDPRWKQSALFQYQDRPNERKGGQGS